MVQNSLRAHSCTHNVHRICLKLCQFMGNIILGRRDHKGSRLPKIMFLIVLIEDNNNAKFITTKVEKIAQICMRATLGCALLYFTAYTASCEIYLGYHLQLLIVEYLKN